MLIPVMQWLRKRGRHFSSSFVVFSLYPVPVLARARQGLVHDCAPPVP